MTSNMYVHAYIVIIGPKVQYACSQVPSYFSIKSMDHIRIWQIQNHSKYSILSNKTVTTIKSGMPSQALIHKYYLTHAWCLGNSLSDWPDLYPVEQNQ